MFIPAALIAGIYGAVHDQLSYTLSPEYFTRFKFIQFAMPWAEHSPRMGAALIGFLASWWVGVIVFAILGLFGFMFASPGLMFRALLKSFLVVLLTTFVIGMLGLLCGYIVVDETSVAGYMPRLQPGVIDAVQFIRVGYMHNAGYLGGVIGLITGIRYLFLQRRKT